MTCSLDLTVQMHNLHKLEFYNSFTFAVNKDLVINAFFEDKEMKYFYTIDKNAVLCIWKFTTDYLSE